MGAGVVHGKKLVKERRRYHDGSEAEEIVPIEGDCCHPSYGRVEEAVRLCERHGVPLDSWPIYYDPYVERALWQGDISLDEVKHKCLRLRQRMGTIDPEALASSCFLKEVWQWLSDGEDFCVWE